MSQPASQPDRDVVAALQAVAAGHDPEPHLQAYLAGLRAAWAIDEAGLLALGPDGSARARAWDGDHAAEAPTLEGAWLPGGRLEPAALAHLRLRRIALWPAGPEALVLLGRRDDGPLPPPLGEPLLSAVILAEQGRSARKALGVAAAVCAAPDESAVWRAVDAGLRSRFAAGTARTVAVAGSGAVIEGHAETAADREALQAVADIVAVALGRAA